MIQLHAWLGPALIAASLAVAVIAGIVALLGRGAGWIEHVRIGLTVAVAVEIALGAVLYATGDRPAETLHLVYGVVALGALPFASSFASEAPPRPRYVVLAFAALVTAGVLWRLTATG